jgi:hypothetical protein
MGAIRLIAAPIRSILRSRLFQLAAVVIIILLLQYANDNSPAGYISDGLDKAVDASVEFSAEFLRLKTFTRSVLTATLMIAYVYIICLLILFLLRHALRLTLDVIGWSNLFYLRNMIARERGIAAYRAWVPLERIRPADIPQQKWEEAFAWPADNKPPYPPLPVRLLRGLLGYVIVVVVAAVLIQLFTPFPVVTWVGEIIAKLGR